MYSKPSASKSAPGVRNPFREFSALLANLRMFPPIAGICCEKPLHLLFEVAVVAAAHFAGDEGGKGADILGDGHLIVVQDDDQVLPQVARLVERFEGHAARSWSRRR